MTTIIINERTKAGKTLFELAKILSVKSKGVIINIDDLQLSADKEAKKIKKAEKKKMIMELSKEVNRSMHQKLIEQYNLHNDSNYR